MSGMDFLFLFLVAVAFVGFTVATAFVSAKHRRPPLRPASSLDAQDNLPHRSAA